MGINNLILVVARWETWAHPRMSGLCEAVVHATFLMRWLKVLVSPARKVTHIRVTF